VKNAKKSQNNSPYHVKFLKMLLNASGKLQSEFSYRQYAGVQSINEVFHVIDKVENV
jgi:hypothetical protein